MFDTVALSKTIVRRPCSEALESFNATYNFSSASTDPYRILINPEKGSHEPRITITRRPNSQYVHRVEVSIGAWLFGSNLHLPAANDIPYFFDALDAYFGERTGLDLDSRTARTARIDLTRDFKTEPSAIPAIIDDYRHFNFPKRNTILINGTTVNFDAKGKEGVSRRATLYSKYHERLDNHATDSELEMAAGILRLEDKYLVNQAVTELSKSLGLRDHNAETMLTEQVHTTVMKKLVERLGIEKAPDRDNSRIEVMFTELGHIHAGRITTHLALERTLGKNYHVRPAYNLSDRTARQRTKNAARFGLIRLE